MHSPPPLSLSASHPHTLEKLECNCCIVDFKFDGVKYENNSIILSPWTTKLQICILQVLKFNLEIDEKDKTAWSRDK